MSLPVPPQVLEKMQSALSNMKCKPSKLPEKLETIEIEDGKFRIYFDGNICILVQLPKLDSPLEDGKILEDGKQFVFFYEHTFSMFAATLNKSSDAMPVLIGDGFYYMPCGEALSEGEPLGEAMPCSEAEAVGDAETEQYRTLGRLLVFAHICRCMVGM